MSLHRLSAGSGFRYLLRHTATGDAASAAGVSGYYQASGNPPGRWLGAGLAGLADGAGLAPGSVVTEAAMTAIFGAAVDPVSGRLLGRGMPRNGVAGFDLTFTVPKSVSVLWALGDPSVQAAVETAHHDAIADVLAHIEARALTTRTGHGGAVSIRTRGAVAAAFDHFDSRAHDPHLHTHLVVANRVQGVEGRWRTIDARALHAGTVAFSELYDGFLADRLAAALPVSFSWRERGPRRAPVFELDGVSDDLLRVFSTRAARIDAAMVESLTAFEARHGRPPTRVETIRLRQQATLATRPVKTIQPLTELQAQWADRAAASGRTPSDVVGTALDTGLDTGLDRTPDGAPAGIASVPGAGPFVEDLAASVVTAVAQRRSTWTRPNLTAEAARALKTHRFPTADIRVAAVDQLVAVAESLCVPLHDPAGLDRLDAPARARVRWTSPAVLDAETRLLAAAADVTAPTALPRPTDLDGLADDQAAALTRAATSGRRVEVIVGPAGTGKTTLLRALAGTWHATHGPGSVIGLAPSAAAADVLARSLGTWCENTAKWLHDPRARAALAWPGRLVIVDEASLASTAHLDAIVGHAVAADAKVLLVGDHHQLAAVEAGGAFGLLARRTHAAELAALWRFRHAWEADATRGLRRGDPAALDTYATHGRLHDGPQEEMVEAAYSAWHADTAAGRHSLLLAADGETVTALNARARTDRILSGDVTPEGIDLRDGTTAGVGDRIITRLNARALTDPAGRHVRNGDAWTVVHAHPFGDLYAVPALPLAEPVGEPRTWMGRPDLVVLPREYVTEHVQLGYAVTVHRAQGSTADTSHLVTGGADGGMSREHLYVALTRGRQANHAYVPVDTAGPETEPHHQRTDPTQAVTGREVLDRILATTSAELSATEHLDELRHAHRQEAWPQQGFSMSGAVTSRTPPASTISR